MTRRQMITGGLGTVLSYGILGHHPAQAQFASVVNDPLNLVQNGLSAVRQLISNANEIRMIQQQVTSLANEAKQLLTLPLSLIEEITTAILGYAQLLQQGQGISYELTAAVQQFEQLYAQGFGGNGTFLQRAERMVAQIRDAGRMATKATAIYDRLCLQQARVTQLMTASQAAVGQLQALQANNQLLGVLAEQQVSMQQVLATEQRLHVSESMERLILQEQAYQNGQRYIAGMTVVPVRGPGQGQGFTLPE